MPRCGCMLRPMFGDPVLDGPKLGRPELTGPAGRVLLGGVNGRNPPRLFDGADWLIPRWGGMLLEPVFDELVLAEPKLVRPDPTVAEERELLFGGVKGRNPPRLPFCADVCTDAGWLPAPLVTELFICLPLWNVPALGFCILPVVFVPWNPAD
jgi:hypothetical protein